MKKQDRHKAKNRKWYNEYKSSLRCELCPESHIACLEFHHPDGDDKFKAVGTMVSQGYCVARILKEMEKCHVLCSNCHKKIHYEQVA